MRAMRSAQERRDEAWAKAVSDFKLSCKSDVATLRAEMADRAQAIEAGQVPSRARFGDLPHLVLTIVTFGLWGPVWLWVWWRNDRRIDRIAMGRDGGRGRRRAARQQLRVDQRAARADITARMRR